MLVSSGTLSFGGSTVGRSLNREFNRANNAQVSLNDFDARITMATNSTQYTAGTVSKVSDFYGRVFPRRATGFESASYFYCYNYATSSTGQIVYAQASFNDGANFDGWIKSTDYGATFSKLTLPENFNSLDCSGDGNIVVGGTYSTGGGVYVSTNGGSTWTKRLTTTSMTNFVSCSSSGALMVCTPKRRSTSIKTQLYVSTDSGTNWTARGISSGYWEYCCCSGTSTYMYATISASDTTNYGLWRSSDSGTNWSKIQTYSSDYVACNDSGAVVYTTMAGGGTAAIYKSTNYGANFSSMTKTTNNSGQLKCDNSGNVFMINYVLSVDGFSTYNTYYQFGGQDIVNSRVCRDGTKAFGLTEYSNGGADTIGVGYLSNL